jgi:hypothetical protein
MQVVNCHIILIKKNNILTNILRLRAVTDGKNIYELSNKKPVMIPCNGTQVSIQAGNGFHSSPEYTLPCTWEGSLLLEIDCAIDNIRFFYIIFLTLLLFTFFIITDLTALKILANLPILYGLFQFYIRKKYFLKIRPQGSPVLRCET